MDGSLPDLAHPGIDRDALAGQLLLEGPANAGVLVLVLDLPAAGADAAVDAVAEQRPLVAAEGVADAAEGDRQVPGGPGGGVEVLVEHHVRGRVDPPGLPVDAAWLLLPLVPEQR